jgi:mono/diheme cytochrome c family protein
MVRLAFALLLLAPQDKKPEDPMSFDRSIRPLLQTYCYRCHNAEQHKADVNLAKDENPRLIAQNRKTWQTVMEVLGQKQMPPKKEKQPSDAQRQQILAFLQKTLGALDCGDARDPGKPVVRRLNRAEYDNSILELTGLNLRLSEGFSPDATGYGFDTIAEALAVSPVLVEQYHEAARKVLAEVIDRKDRNPAAHARVFHVRPSKDLAERDAARRVADRFALKAFRRPADPAFVDKLLGLYDKARAKGEGHEGAVKPMLLAVLISPRFLMRIEASRPGVQGPYPVDDYDLATRLSFFLWSGPPDDELLDLAAKGALRAPEVLDAQARRLLADPRSRALAENFIGQWLQLRGLAGHKPDPKVFPEFSETLRGAMQRELDLFLGEIIRQDRPVTELIDADYTFVNEELARHYGLEGVRGPEMRRVALPDRRRGGVLTSAALLTTLSDPERNNVPRRGNYVAGTILGAPPPPPPPDVPALEDSKAAGKAQTLRQLLEAHRSKPDCAGCHAKIDPLGFGFENYDAIGRWRDREGGAAVDASGVLPNGREFNGPVELKKILLERRDAFVRTMAENMLIYAMGRGLQLEDECVVRDVLKAAAAGGYRVSTLVLTIVRSHPFRHRRNPDF